MNSTLLWIVVAGVFTLVCIGTFKRFCQAVEPDGVPWGYYIFLVVCACLVVIFSVLAAVDRESSVFLINSSEWRIFVSSFGYKVFVIGFIWLVVIGVILVKFSVIFGEKRVMKRIASGVDKRQVPVLGDRKFRARVEITYTNGELKSVVLISGTTDTAT